MIETGINLTNSAFQSDWQKVIADAKDAGVTAMVVTGTDIEESQQAALLCEQVPGYLYSTAGIHPHDAKHFNDNSLDQLKTLLALPQVKAVGECGLDFNRDYSPRPDQELAFEAQLALAAELGMPVFMHERDANQRFIDILRPWRDKLPAAVLHCFTGSESDLKACLALDLHIGITGWICDERRGSHLKDLVRLIPDNRLMIETDSPYLLPRDLKPKPKSRRNEPKYLPHVAAAIAAARGESLETFLAHTVSTTNDFFNLK